MKENNRLYRFIFGDGREMKLPKTRRDAFFQYGKMNFIKLMLSGAITSSFFLPALLWLYSANYSRAKAIEALDGAAADYDLKLREIILQHALTDYLVLIPLLAIFFVGLAGMLDLAKKICFYRRAPYSEFFTAMKSNLLGALGIGTIFGVGLFFLSFNLSYYSVSDMKPLIKGIFIGFALIIFAIVTIFSVYAMCGLAVYTNTLIGHLRNSIRLTFGLFFKNLLYIGAIFSPLIITLLIPSPWQLIPLALMPVFYVGFASFALMCYTVSVFDLYINPSLGTEFVNIGLQKQEISDEISTSSNE